MRTEHTLNSSCADTAAHTPPGSERDPREYSAASETTATIINLAQARFGNPFGLSYRVRKQLVIGRRWIVQRYGRAYDLRFESNGEFSAALCGHDVSLQGIGDTPEQALDSCDDNVRSHGTFEFALGVNDVVHAAGCWCNGCGYLAAIGLRGVVEPWTHALLGIEPPREQPADSSDPG